MNTESTNDTSPEALRVLVEGYRKMTPAQKLGRVVALTQGVQQMALARIRASYPEADETEQTFRLAALWLPAELMKRAFGWDPDARGY